MKKQKKKKRECLKMMTNKLKMMTNKCFICERIATCSCTRGELWFKHLNAKGDIIVVMCNRQDNQHIQIGSDLRRAIQGEDRVVLLDAFIP